MGDAIDLRGLRFGAELETVGRSRRRVAEAIRTIVGGTVRHVGQPSCYDPWEVTDTRGRVWKVVADSSLTSVPFHLRAEVVSPILTYGDMRELQRVVRAIRQVAQARVDDMCSVHLHLDGSLFDARSLANLAKTFYKYEDLIVRALGVSPSRLQRYCKPIPEDFIRGIERRRPRTEAELNRLWYGYYNTAPSRLDSTRYVALNLNAFWSRGTVEVRVFNGCLHAGKIRAYAVLCLALAAKALNGRAASSKRRKPDGKTDKYTFRTLLLHLRLSGDEFKTCRKHLLANLAGSAAWKHGRPLPKAEDKPKGEDEGSQA